MWFGRIVFFPTFSWSFFLLSLTDSHYIQEIREQNASDVLTLLDNDLTFVTDVKDVFGEKLGHGNWSKEVLLDPELHRMLVRYWCDDIVAQAVEGHRRQSELCFVVRDTHTIRTAFARGVHPDTKVRRLPGDEFDAIMASCLNATSPSFYRYLTIFPGTNYCGAGDVAPRPGILGKKRELDKCCYWHDLCHFSIPAGSQWNNITNRGSYTISACECDEKFLDCLSALRSRDSRIVRYVYFDWLRLPCIRLNYPILRCVHKDWFGRCVKYALDLSSSRKEWQVVESPFISELELEKRKVDLTVLPAQSVAN